MAEGANWLGLKQAAQQLGVSERTVRRWLTTGKLEGRRVSTPFGPGWAIKVDSAPLVAPKGADMIGTANAPPLAELVALVERQQGRIVELASRLAVAEAEIERLAITALQAPQPEPVATEPTPAIEAVSKPVTRPWWRRWLG